MELEARRGERERERERSLEWGPGPGLGMGGRGEGGTLSGAMMTRGTLSCPVGAMVPLVFKADCRLRQKEPNDSNDCMC